MAIIECGGDDAPRENRLACGFPMPSIAVQPAASRGNEDEGWMRSRWMISATRRNRPRTKVGLTHNTRRPSSHVPLSPANWATPLPHVELKAQQQQHIRHATMTKSENWLIDCDHSANFLSTSAPEYARDLWSERTSGESPFQTTPE